jgi:hypothetical protein
MAEWKNARKKPVNVEYREVEPLEATRFSNKPFEIIKTREGVLLAYSGEDYVIRGIEGELYPIKKTIFEKTYEIL